MSEDYFDSVERQLAGLCRQGAHRSRCQRPRRSGRTDFWRVAGVTLSVLVALAVVGLALGLHHGSPGSVSPRASGGPPGAGRSRVIRPAVARQRQPVVAHVIARDPTLWYTTLELDKGSQAGVLVNDPVIGDGAVVGKITTVNSTSSILTLITDPTFAISAEVQDSAGDTGVLVPAVGNPHLLLLQHLPSHAAIQIGQQVVTAGFRSGSLASLYPAGSPIGQVASANENQLHRHGEVQVTPDADLRHLNVVQILASASAHSESPSTTSHIDPTVASQLSVFSRPQTSADALPAAFRGELQQAYAGEQPAVGDARRVKASDGQTTYLVPTKGGACVINTNESLCSPAATLPGAATVDLCSPTLPQGQLEIEWLLPDGATHVALSNANGTATRFAPSYNVYIARLPLSGPQPQTIEWDAEGQHHSASAGVPSDAQSQTCAHPRHLTVPPKASSRKPTATIETVTGPGVATVAKP